MDYTYGKNLIMISNSYNNNVDKYENVHITVAACSIHITAHVIQVDLKPLKVWREKYNLKNAK